MKLIHFHNHVVPNYIVLLMCILLLLLLFIAVIIYLGIASDEVDETKHCGHASDRYIKQYIEVL